jgi:hypothetical protein
MNWSGRVRVSARSYASLGLTTLIMDTSLIGETGSSATGLTSAAYGGSSGTMDFTPKHAAWDNRHCQAQCPTGSSACFPMSISLTHVAPPGENMDIPLNFLTGSAGSTAPSMVFEADFYIYGFGSEGQGSFPVSVYPY